MNKGRPARTSTRKVQLQGYETVGIFRLCRRCKRWHSIGNFTFNVDRGKTYAAHVCHRCLTPENKRTSYIEQRWWWPAQERSS